MKDEQSKRINQHRDLILNTDVADSVQGHVGPNTPQVFKTLWAVPFKLPALKLDGYEFLMHDQFGNHYHKMRAVLFDGELYDADQFIKPSWMMRTGGGHADFEDRFGKQRLRITETLLRELRDNGAQILGRANIEILKGRSVSQSPVAIETADISHSANALEDSILAHKQAAGEEVKAETTPDGFVPLKATESPLPANVYPFPNLTPAIPADTTIIP